MTAYIDARLLAATRTHKIRNDVRGEVPAAIALLVIISVLVGLASGNRTAAVLFGAVVAAAVLIQLPLLLWAGADLNPSAIEIHRLGRRVVPWSQIQLLTAERSWCTVRIVVWTARGERIALRAPTITAWGGGRSRFTQDYRTIEQYWADYRGAYWQPPMSPTRPVSAG